MTETRIYETDELSVTAKGEMVTIEVCDGHWVSVPLDRNQARNLAAQLLAWCASGETGQIHE